MSAWARLVAKASPEELEELNAAMVEIQAETARRLAEKVRTAARERYDQHSHEYGSWHLYCTEGANWAAGLIDSEVSSG